MPHTRPRRALGSSRRPSAAPPARRIAAPVVAIGLSLAGVYGLNQSTVASAGTAPLSQSSALDAPGATPAPSATASPATEDASDATLVPAELLVRQAALEQTRLAAAAESERLLTVGKFYYPTVGEIGSKWGMRLHPILRVQRMHAGIDVGSPCDAPVWAVLSGTVVATGHGAESGNYVKIDHGLVEGRRLETMYLHMNRVEVTTGQAVTRGQHLGLSGNTGLSTSCHVHLALNVDGVNSDPMPYLNA